MLVWQANTHQLLSHPLGALGEKLEVRVGVNVEDIEKLGLEKCANINPLLMNLLNSIKVEMFLTK